MMPLSFTKEQATIQVRKKGSEKIHVCRENTGRIKRE